MSQHEPQSHTLTCAHAPTQVCELFEVSPELLLRPATQRQILAAILARQMDVYFAKAVGCNASPASMVGIRVLGLLRV